MRNESEMTPLQIKLNELALEVAKIGSMTGALFFVSLLIRYLVQPGTQRYLNAFPLASELIPRFLMQSAE